MIIERAGRRGTTLATEAGILLRYLYGWLYLPGTSWCRQMNLPMHIFKERCCGIDESTEKHVVVYAGKGHENDGDLANISSNADRVGILLALSLIGIYGLVKTVVSVSSG
ncbi:hypothetical protein CHS0354_038119 [Potamilus streckersoni]|uniref:Uncharacterized protein n=1 Tax=Potamilus streckersoni TaxID=2493646 RepID=A0AAE0VWD7_9BIVA|nr:hypothetical protein CHS0354_038119 [Potamilus streckersoni]